MCAGVTAEYKVERSRNFDICILYFTPILVNSVHKVFKIF